MRSPDPCPRCLALAFNDQIRPETVMPIPSPAPPLAVEDVGTSMAGTPICHDCQAAENLAKLDILAAWVADEPGGIKRPYKPKGMAFSSRRIVVGNERQEQLRLPEGMRPHFGLVRIGLVRMTEGEEALERHCAWLDQAMPGWNGGS